VIPTQFEDRRLQRSRINQITVIVILAFLVLLSRLWYLQIALGKELMVAAENNATKLLRTRAPRGTILDRKGRIIATSRPQFVVLALPEKLEANQDALNTLCGILQMTPDEVKETIKKQHARPGSPVRIKVDVALETVARIGEMRMSLPGVSVELDQLRNYPDGPAVAHIMGQLGEISQAELDAAHDNGVNYTPGDYVGKSGLEKQYETDLKGVDGGKKIMVNAMGQVVRILGEKPSIPGHAIKLTIDRDLQVAASRAMGTQTGACVALDPQTGAVLAMVSEPSYDPNIFVKKVTPTDWDKINQNKGRPQQNRAVYNVYPPGSTFKPMMAIAGLVYKQCDLNTTYSCPGSFRYGRVFHCWKVHGGGVNFNRAIAESCDVWFYHLALALGVDRMAKVARQFGLSKATGIDLPHESRYKDGHVGTMPDTAWKWKRYHQKWYPGETPSCGIGQGYIQVSPLQLAVAIAGVADDGKIHRPYLLDKVLGSNGQVLMQTHPEIVRQVDAPVEDFRKVQNAMRQTITAGTGRVANIPDITVCGKTGSAEDPPRPAHGWFVCFAPEENPKIVVVCIVEHGRHGASTAAPVCRAVLDVFFGKKKPEDIGSGNVQVHGD